MTEMSSIKKKVFSDNIATVIGMRTLLCWGLGLRIYVPKNQAPCVAALEIAAETSEYVKHRTRVSIIGFFNEVGKNENFVLLPGHTTTLSHPKSHVAAFDFGS